MAKLYLSLLCALSGIVLVCSSDFGGNYGGPGVGYPAAYPRYNYGYSVNDPRTGDVKSAGEVRDGDAVRGHYQLLDSDGSLRTVSYIADAGGFRANVHRTPNGRGHVYSNGYLG